MTALITLQTQLESVLNQEGLSEDFKAAISDGLYAADLSQVALEQWIDTWKDGEDVICLSGGEDKEYQQGVRFVEQQWEAITGMF